MPKIHVVKVKGKAPVPARPLPPPTPVPKPPVRPAAKVVRKLPAKRLADYRHKREAFLVGVAAAVVAEVESRRRVACWLRRQSAAARRMRARLAEAEAHADRVTEFLEAFTVRRVRLFGFRQNVRRQVVDTSRLAGLPPGTVPSLTVTIAKSSDGFSYRWLLREHKAKQTWVSRASYSTAREAAEAVLTLLDTYVVLIVQDDEAVRHQAEESARRPTWCKTGPKLPGPGHQGG
jgi:hypothetical protein